MVNFVNLRFVLRNLIKMLFRAEEGGEDHRNVLKKLIFLLIERLKGDIINHTVYIIKFLVLKTTVTHLQFHHFVIPFH
jgi:hypothetical protein